MKAPDRLRQMLMRASAMVLSLLGGLGAMISVLTLIDPIGAQMADDAHPFAMPPGPGASWLHFAVSLALSGLGLFLHRRSAQAA
ncbi:hypothetical protein [Lysobacter antibioticus]|uniref:hypothetical protein n=1 Tax=Lysobacter antibioticus TaxID=84531 RepID=UPI000ADF01DD|nr:hypothetical protein [Lysobacter antibioticus]